MVNVLGGASMDHSIAPLNDTHKKPYKRYEGKTNDVLIAFSGYVNDLNKFRVFQEE